MALTKDRMPHDQSLQQQVISLDHHLSNNGFVFRSAASITSCHQADDDDDDDQVAAGHSVINFKNNSFFHDNSASSLLSFEKNDQNSLTNYLKTNHDENDATYHCISVDPNRLSGDFNSFQTASNYSSISNPSKENHGSELGSAYGWLYSEATLMADSFIESETNAQAAFQKRPHTVFFLPLNHNVMLFCIYGRSRFVSNAN